jgi:hypothetical protein
MKIEKEKKQNNKQENKNRKRKYLKRKLLSTACHTATLTRSRRITYSYEASGVHCCLLLGRSLQALQAALSCVRSLI